MSKWQPQPNTEREQPHDSCRDERQPYAKELDDYAQQIATPPRNKSGPAIRRPQAKLRKERCAAARDEDRRAQNGYCA